jgi:hypothetical protein
MSNSGNSSVFIIVRAYAERDGIARGAPQGETFFSLIDSLQGNFLGSFERIGTMAYWLEYLCTVRCI